jgi:tripartite-type tricarboxylate transporter receptor subunit TctC
MSGTSSRQMARMPTLAEQGTVSLNVDIRFALLAPASLRPAIAKDLRAFAASVAGEPSSRAEMEEAGFHPLDDEHDHLVRSVADSVRMRRRLAQQAGML